MRLFTSAPDRVLCGVPDYPIGGADLPCPDVADVLAGIHCDHCGCRLRAVCTHHLKVLAAGNTACQPCATDGRQRRVTYMWTSPYRPGESIPGLPEPAHLAEVAA